MAIVNGTSGSETINGADGVTNGFDVVYGYGGNDAIYGLGGDDALTAGSAPTTSTAGPASIAPTTTTPLSASW